jgi:hypothetical protein
MMFGVEKASGDLFGGDPSLVDSVIRTLTKHTFSGVDKAVGGLNKT